MSTTRESVLAWMEDHNHSRDWLAEKCGVGPSAVSNWLRKNKPRPIPAKAALIIQNLIEVDEAKEEQEANLPQNLVLEFSKEVFDRICDRALEEKMKPREWAETELMKLADMDMTHLAEKLRGKVTPLPTKPLPRKKAALMAAAGTEEMAIECEVGDWDMVNGTVPVRIVGDSMEPVFHDDDVITIRHKDWSRSPFMKKGLIYLVRYNDGYLLKRYKTRKPTEEDRDAEYLTNTGMVGVLESLNPKFPDIDITGPFDWEGWYDERVN